MIDQARIRERVTTDDESMPLRAAIYARTSSEKQKHGYSLEEQVNRCIDRCESLNWEVRFIYRDEAESGKNTDRPMFQKMLDMAPKQVFHVIVFWKLDRFSRSLMHAVQLESELREYGVNLYSVTEQIDTTSATGRFNFRNLASAAEFERDMIRQRSMVGLNGMAKENRWPNNSPPLGYKLTSEQKLSILEKEKDLVIKIFDLYIEKRSMPEVAESLNEQGTKTREGNEWTPRAVGDVLRNEIYRGRYELGEVSKHVPEYQIVEDDVFEKVTSIRMRFQNGGASRAPMSDSRKEKSIKAIREQFFDYLGRCHSEGNAL